MNEINNLSDFGTEFQEKVVQALIYDKQWALGMVDLLDVDSSFDLLAVKLVADEYMGFYKKHKEFPSLNTLMMVVRDKVGENEANKGLRSQVVDLFTHFKSNKDCGDLPWVKEKTEEFCRHQIIKKALNESIKLFQAGKYDSIYDEMKDAVSRTINQTTGHDYNEDIDARYSQTNRSAIATGLPELDNRYILNGGLGNGELGVVVANSGYGKTHIKVHFGAQALMQGHNVFHYSFELKERIVGIRYDSHLVQIPSTDCPDNIDIIKGFFRDNQAQLGRLIIKEYPTNTATIVTLRSHIEKMAMKGIRPGMIIVDYAQIMRSTERHDVQRFEYKRIVEELRSLAMELNVPVWTSVQANKEGVNSEIVDTTNMSEAYSQSNIADLVLGFSRPKDLKVSGLGKLHIAKNRAGIDGETFPCHLDTAKSTLRILSDDEFDLIKQGYDDSRGNDEDDDHGDKKSIRDKINESRHTLNNRDYLTKFKR